MNINIAAVYALRSNEERKEGKQPTAKIVDEREPSKQARYIICRQCGQRLTRPSERIAVNGSHTHTFANPSGLVFEIGCFNMATGCAFIGPPSMEFPWFTGYTWQIAICSTCQTHLGWLFLGQNSQQFFGFILDRLQDIGGPD
jgi:hypothetical protein